MIIRNQLNMKSMKRPFFKTYIQKATPPSNQRSIRVSFTEPTLFYSLSLSNRSALKLNSIWMEKKLSSISEAIFCAFYVCKSNSSTPAAFLILEALEMFSFSPSFQKLNNILLSSPLWETLKVDYNFPLLLWLFILEIYDFSFCLCLDLNLTIRCF